MKFLDEAKIHIKAGDGGDGVAAFCREKFIEFGGPSGGDGGHGGSVIIKAVDNLNTLIDYRYQQHFKAEKGQRGMGKDKHGRAGKDMLLVVPIGTVIYAEDKKTILADLDKKGAEFLVAKGGKGGLGNLHFKSSTNRAPRQYTSGKKGEELSIWLKLKIIADVGLIGLPNAGKSTLLSVLSSAKPKIADYPFTTLIPALGAIKNKGASPFIIADLPGLIEGAAEGVGLGTRFLAHAERCQLLLHLVAIDGDNPFLNYQTIRKEILAYDKKMADKPEWILLSRTDLCDAKEAEKIAKQFKQKTKKEIMIISSKTHYNIDRLIKRLSSDLAGGLVAK